MSRAGSKPDRGKDQWRATARRYSRGRNFSEEFHGPPVVRGNLPFVLNLYVEDADAAWAKALQAGCEVVFSIGDQFWGDRYGQVRDPFGFVWAIATVKEVLTPEEMQAQQGFRKRLEESDRGQWHRARSSAG